MRPFICSVSLTLLVLVTNASVVNPVPNISDLLKGFKLKASNLPDDQNFVDKNTCTTFWDDDAKKLGEKGPLKAGYYMQKAVEESFTWLDEVAALVEQVKLYDNSALSRTDRMDLNAKTNLPRTANQVADDRQKPGFVVSASGSASKKPLSPEAEQALRIGIRSLLKFFFGESTMTQGPEAPMVLQKLRLIATYRGLSSATAPKPKRPHFGALFCGDENLQHQVLLAQKMTLIVDETAGVMAWSRILENTPHCFTRPYTVAYTRPSWWLTDRVVNPYTAMDVIYFCKGSFNLPTGPREALEFRKKNEKNWLSKASQELLMTGYSDKFEGYLRLHHTILHETFHMRRWDKADAAAHEKAYPEPTTDDVVNPLGPEGACYGLIDCARRARLPSKDASENASNNADSFAYLVVTAKMFKHAIEQDGSKPKIRGLANDGEIVEMNYLPGKDDNTLLKLFEAKRKAYDKPDPELEKYRREASTAGSAAGSNAGKQQQLPVQKPGVKKNVSGGRHRRVRF